MQVQQIEDTTDIYAAVGGKTKESEFTVSNSSAFFTLISKTLYTNELLAALREPICNGWDSHIKNNKTDIPLEITVNQVEVVIRDFGSGIPHDKFNSVALSFGDSTKVESVDETGGFGLGFKAPFANGHTFNCDNYYGGIKKVFEMQSAEISDTGRPKAIEVVAVPTTETGIKIRMPLKPGQYNEALRNVMNIVIFGGIRAIVNGTKVAYYPTEDFKEGFICWWTNQYDGGASTSDVTIRYGSVLYPLPRAITKNQGYRSSEPTELETITNEVTKLYKSVHLAAGKPITLLAKSGSLTIMPSREELSESLENMRTIKQLMVDFLERAKDAFWEVANKQHDADYYNNQKASLMRQYDNNPFIVYSIMLETERPQAITQVKNVVGTVADLHSNRWRVKYISHVNRKKYLDTLFDLHEEHPNVMLPNTEEGTYGQKMFTNYSKRFRKIQKKLIKLGALKSHIGTVTGSTLRRLSEEQKITTHYGYGKLAVDRIAKVIFIGYTDTDIWNLRQSLDDDDPNIELRNIGYRYYYKVSASEWKHHKEGIVKIFEDAGYYVVDVTKKRDEHRKQQAEEAAERRKLERENPTPKQEKLFNAYKFPKWDVDGDYDEISHKKLEISYIITGARYVRNAIGLPSGTVKLVHKLGYANKYDGTFMYDGYGMRNIQTPLENCLKYLAQHQDVYMVITLPRYNALIKDGAKDWVTHVHEQIIELVKVPRLRKLVQSFMNWDRYENRVVRNFAMAIMADDDFYEKLIGNVSPFDRKTTALLLVAAACIGDWTGSYGTNGYDNSEVKKAVNLPVPDSTKRAIESDNPIFWFFSQAHYYDMPEKAQLIVKKLL